MAENTLKTRRETTAAAEDALRKRKEEGKGFSGVMKRYGAERGLAAAAGTGLLAGTAATAARIARRAPGTFGTIATAGATAVGAATTAGIAYQMRKQRKAESKRLRDAVDIAKAEEYTAQGELLEEVYKDKNIQSNRFMQQITRDRESFHNFVLSVYIVNELISDPVQLVRILRVNDGTTRKVTFDNGKLYIFCKAIQDMYSPVNKTNDGYPEEALVDLAELAKTRLEEASEAADEAAYWNAKTDVPGTRADCERAIDEYDEQVARRILPMLFKSSDADTPLGDFGVEFPTWDAAAAGTGRPAKAAWFADATGTEIEASVFLERLQQLSGGSSRLYNDLLIELKVLLLNKAQNNPRFVTSNMKDDMKRLLIQELEIIDYLFKELNPEHIGYGPDDSTDPDDAAENHKSPGNNRWKRDIVSNYNEINRLKEKYTDLTMTFDLKEEDHFVTSKAIAVELNGLVGTTLANPVLLRLDQLKNQSDDITEESLVNGEYFSADETYPSPMVASVDATTDAQAVTDAKVVLQEVGYEIADAIEKQYIRNETGQGILTSLLRLAPTLTYEQRRTLGVDDTGASRDKSLQSNKHCKYVQTAEKILYYLQSHCTDAEVKVKSEDQKAEIKDAVNEMILYYDSQPHDLPIFVKCLKEIIDGDLTVDPTTGDWDPKFNPTKLLANQEAHLAPAGCPLVGWVTKKVLKERISARTESKGLPEGMDEDDYTEEEVKLSLFTEEVLVTDRCIEAKIGETTDPPSLDKIVCPAFTQCILSRGKLFDDSNTETENIFLDQKVRYYSIYQLHMLQKRSEIHTAHINDISHAILLARLPDSPTKQDLVDEIKGNIETAKAKLAGIQKRKPADDASEEVRQAWAETSAAATEKLRTMREDESKTLFKQLVEAGGDLIRRFYMAYINGIDRGRETAFSELIAGEIMNQLKRGIKLKKKYELGIIYRQLQKRGIILPKSMQQRFELKIKADEQTTEPKLVATLLSESVVSKLCYSRSVEVFADIKFYDGVKVEEAAEEGEENVSRTGNRLEAYKQLRDKIMRDAIEVISEEKGEDLEQYGFEPIMDVDIASEENLSTSEPTLDIEEARQMKDKDLLDSFLSTLEMKFRPEDIKDWQHRIRIADLFDGNSFQQKDIMVAYYVIQHNLRKQRNAAISKAGDNTAKATTLWAYIESADASIRCIRKLELYFFLAIKNSVKAMVVKQIHQVLRKITLKDKKKWTSGDRQAIFNVEILESIRTELTQYAEFADDEQMSSFSTGVFGSTHNSKTRNKAAEWLTALTEQANWNRLKAAKMTNTDSKAPLLGLLDVQAVGKYDSSPRLVFLDQANFHDWIRGKTEEASKADQGNKVQTGDTVPAWDFVSLLFEFFYRSSIRNDMELKEAMTELVDTRNFKKDELVDDDIWEILRFAYTPGFELMPPVRKCLANPDELPTGQVELHEILIDSNVGYLASELRRQTWVTLERAVENIPKIFDALADPSKDAIDVLTMKPQASSKLRPRRLSAVQREASARKDQVMVEIDRVMSKQANITSDLATQETELEKLTAKIKEDSYSLTPAGRAEKTQDRAKMTHTIPKTIERLKREEKIYESKLDKLLKSLSDMEASTGAISSLRDETVELSRDEENALSQMRQWLVKRAGTEVSKYHPDILFFKGELLHKYNGKMIDSLDSCIPYDPQSSRLRTRHFVVSLQANPYIPISLSKYPFVIISEDYIDFDKRVIKSQLLSSEGLSVLSSLVEETKEEVARKLMSPSMDRDLQMDFVNESPEWEKTKKGALSELADLDLRSQDGQTKLTRVAILRVLRDGGVEPLEIRYFIDATNEILQEYQLDEDTQELMELAREIQTTEDPTVVRPTSASMDLYSEGGSSAFPSEGWSASMPTVVPGRTGDSRASRRSRSPGLSEVGASFGLKTGARDGGGTEGGYSYGIDPYGSSYPTIPGSGEYPQAARAGSSGYPESMGVYSEEEKLALPPPPPGGPSYPGGGQFLSQGFQPKAPSRFSQRMAETKRRRQLADEQKEQQLADETPGQPRGAAAGFNEAEQERSDLLRARLAVARGEQPAPGAVYEPGAAARQEQLAEEEERRRLTEEREAAADEDDGA